MIKKIVFFICTLMICLGFVPMKCKAAVVDPDRSCSLTISYTKNGVAFEGLNIEIYRVAEFFENGSYRLLEPFSTYPIKIYGVSSQQEWQEIAQTIKSYVEEDKTAAYQSQKTDRNGHVFFGNLETGLYMIKGVSVQNENKVVVFQDFMMYVPTLVENDYDYDVEAKPKSMEYVQPEKYTVVKLWKDLDDSQQRPKSICVETLKDGVLQESVILDSTNNWSYSWDVSEKGGIWSVVEKDVPDGYQVSIVNNQTTFVITNSKGKESSENTGKPDLKESIDPVQPTVKTGDTAPFLMYVIILFVAGFGLMLFGILRQRENKDEKKQ